MNLYSLIINSSFDEVNKAVVEIIEFLKEKCNIFDSHLLFKIDFVLRELLNNAVEHGNKMIVNKKVWLDLIYNSKKITIKVKDEGNGFNFDYNSGYKKKDTVEERTRGLNIIEKMKLKLIVVKNCVSVEFHL